MEDALPALRSPGALAVPRAGPSYSRLELRRNLALYAGWPAVITGSVPLFAWLASQAGVPVAQGVGGTLLAWAFGGLPITAVLFGAVAGAGLRGPAEEQEACLPVSPRQRLLGALASSAAVLAVCAVLVLVLTAALSPVASDFLFEPMSFVGRGWPLERAAAALAAAMMLGWMLTVSCAVAYAAAHAVLGGVTGLIGAAFVLAPIAAGFMLQGRYPQTAAYAAQGLCWLTVCGAGTLAALSAAARLPAVAGRRWWTRAAAVALLPFAGAPGAWHSVFAARQRVLLLSEVPLYGGTRLPGQLRTSIGGRLVMLTDGGAPLVLLPGDPPGLAELMRSGPFASVHAAFRDRTGRLWASVWHPDSSGRPSYYDVWVGDGNGPLKRYMTLPPGMEIMDSGGEAAVRTNGAAFDPNRPFFVKLDASLPPPPLKPQ